MPRLFAFLAALICSAVVVSSACTAGPTDGIQFTLQPERQSGRIQASFRKAGPNTNKWSTSFPTSELRGLDSRRLRAAGRGPIRFAVIREAGRLDCAGSGGGSRASGTCSFTADANFISLLVSRGINRPTSEQAFGLMALNVRRELVDALRAARYPVPSVDQLMALTAVGANGRYITGLASAGYRTSRLDSVVELKALNVTPEYIRGFVRAGYGTLRTEELAQLKALSVTPEFAAGFQRIGYGQLATQDLVQLRTLGVTPDFAVSVRRERGSLPSVDELIRRRLGVEARVR